MGRIRVLSEDVQKAIRAGEVIERPASVLKELLENSLDAEATEITVDILSYGEALIRVSDNGKGILNEDLPLCVMRHTTSKISSLEDLTKINTLGFRGEALYSIASVSKLRITSQAKEESIGSFIEVHAGRLISKGPASTVGTTVEVRELFYNTPARKKFLKSPRTELFHLISVFQETALCYPDVAFILNINRKNTLELPRAFSVKERLIQIYGYEESEGLIEANIEGVHLFINTKGHTGKHVHFISVNNRAVQDRIIRSAVAQAIKETIGQELRTLSFFIFLNISPELVDFNVHPQKKEVRFKDERKLFQKVYYALKEALMVTEKQQYIPKELSSSKKTTTYTEINNQHQPNHALIIQENFNSDYESVSYRFLPITTGYFCFSDEEALYVVDQHAAHERILYEKLKGNLPVETKRLLFPCQIRFPVREFEAIQTIIPLLKEMGFEVEVFGDKTLLLKTLPDGLPESSIEELLIDLTRKILEIDTGLKDIERLKDQAAKTIACHKSIRADQQLTESEMKILIQQLYQTQEPTR